MEITFLSTSKNLSLKICCEDSISLMIKYLIHETYKTYIILIRGPHNEKLLMIDLTIVIEKVLHLKLFHKAFTTNLRW